MLAGKPVDRPPVSVWGHFFNLEDRHTKDFAKATIDFQRCFDFDIVKVMPNSYYMAEGWGNIVRPSEHFQDPALGCCTHLAVQESEDWKKLKVLDPTKGSLAREVTVLRMICDHFKDEVPVIQTIFSPLMWACQLFIEQKVRAIMMTSRPYGLTPFLIDYLERHEKEITPALEVIAESNDRVMKAFLDAGAHGFFYANLFINEKWDKDRYEYFSGRYERQNLEAVKDKTLFTIMHVCRPHHLNFDLVLDYPVDAFNWEDTSPDNPSMAELREKTDKVFVGGLDRHNDLAGPDRDKIKEAVKEHTRAAIKAAGRKLVISGGCDWQPQDMHRFGVMNEAIDEVAVELGYPK
jgi:uroporphyrinogen decarboxylase